VFYSKANSTDGMTTQARDARSAAQTAQVAAQTAQAAAQTAQAAAQAARHWAAPRLQTAALGVGSAAQTAAGSVSKSMQQGVYAARGWAAPRLETAADYTTTTAAPAVSAALRSTAKQVSPVDYSAKSRGIRSTMSWAALALAILAAGGAAGFLVRRRMHAAIDADTEADAMEVADANEPSSAPGEQPTQGQPTQGQQAQGQPGTAQAGGGSGVDGRVSTSGS
jgi:hypothetical protein